MVRLRILSWGGLALYFVSYFLPAVGNPDNKLGHAMPGWFCACFSLWFGVAGIFDWRGMRGIITPDGHTLFLSLIWPGLANPLLLLYGGLVLKRQGVLFRHMLLALILILAGYAAVVIHRMAMVPLLGYYLWVAGLVMMLSPEIMSVIGEMRIRLANTAG